MTKPIIGAQLYTVREFTKTIVGVRETLTKISDIGYRNLQISAFGPVDWNEVAHICRGEGLRVASTHTDWNRFREELDGVIEEHKILGCKHLAIGGLPIEYRSDEGLKRFIDELCPIAEELKEQDMDFSYHNHHHELVRYNGKTWLEMLYEKAPGVVLKAEIDTYWIQAGGGDPALWIKRCAGRAPLVHFKDMSVGSEHTQKMAEVGEGNLNWNAIIEACVEADVEYALVEQDDCYGRDPFESLAISYKNLKAMGL